MSMVLMSTSSFKYLPGFVVASVDCDVMVETFVETVFAINDDIEIKIRT